MRGKARILVVDDEAKICEKLDKLLSQEGYQVTTASSGEEALKALGEQTFEVIVADIRLPSMDGISLLKNLKKHAPEVGVIMITGYGEVETYLESLSLGAFEYLHKPINFNHLNKTISKFLGKEPRK